jgi:hypothetical protein
LVLVGCGGDVVIAVDDNVDATEVSEVSVDSFVATESAVDASDTNEVDASETCGTYFASCAGQADCCLGYVCNSVLEVCVPDVVVSYQAAF